MSSDDIVALLRAPELCICVDAVLANCSPCNARIQAADEIERLRAENAALYEANHQAMWDDTLIPIANALGVAINDEYGIPRRQFQMVDAIIKEARRAE